MAGVLGHLRKRNRKHLSMAVEFAFLLLFLKKQASMESLSKLAQVLILLVLMTV